MSDYRWCFKFLDIGMQYQAGKISTLEAINTMLDTMIEYLSERIAEKKDVNE